MITTAIDTETTTTMVFLLVQGVVYTLVSSHYFIMCSDRSRFLSSFFKKGQPALVSVRDIIEANKTSTYLLLTKVLITWPRLFKRLIALSGGQISIQWIVQSVFLILICWIVIYPMDSAIQRLNNRGLEAKLYRFTTVLLKLSHSDWQHCFHCIIRQPHYFTSDNPSIYVILRN